MTLIYFDGFDLHNRVLTGLDVGAGAMQDAGYYWRGGTITAYDFPVGYDEGRSFWVTRSGTNNAGSLRVGKGEARVGFWAAHNAAAVMTLIHLGDVYQVNPALNITYSAGSIIMYLGGVIVGSYPGLATSEWRYHEIYANSTTGVYQVSIDGVLLIDYHDPNTYPLLQTYFLTLSSPSLSSAPFLRFDHLWVTDGPFPEGTDILGVQVSASLDKYDSNSSGFTGSLVIGGERYITPMLSPLVKSQADYGQDGNYVNVLNFGFFNDPSTGTPWTMTGYNAIEKWGLCYVLRDGVPTKSRVVGLVLNQLVYNQGRPLVRFRRVDGSGEFSGPWTRTDPTKSYSYHLQEVPRSNVEDFTATATALFIEDDGCALFKGPATGPSVQPVFQDIGLTFAEEFREDYTDWVRIDGSGVNFESMFVSGYGVYGEGNRKFQSNYVTVNYENVPTGGAYIQGLWDYTIDPDTGRWSMRQNVYKDTEGFKHGTRRLKIRGHGKTLQLRVSSRDGKPFKINGWTILVSSNTNV